MSRGNDSSLRILNYIGGTFVAPKSGAYLDNWEAATGQVYSQVADSDERDVEDAVRAARAAFPAWSGLPSEDRARGLRALAALIDRDLERFAAAESRDTGKPLSLARSVDLPRARANFEFFADAITQFSSEFHAGAAGSLNYTLRAPLGVIGAISPWNLPLYLLSWKIAPALAAGNCVVAKPSEVTPMTAHLMAELCFEAGIPAGVLNLVHGLGPKVGTALTRHPQVKAISFTGSTRVGEEIARITGPAFKKVSLEMGGKNPNVIFADVAEDPALYERALATTVRAAFSNQGQICLCGSRILVERPIYEKFRDELVKRIRALRQGDPALEATEQGALVSQVHYGKVLAGIALARAEGGHILCGGEPAMMEGRCAKGWFVQPTLIEGLGPECRTNQEEIFGPVATIAPFERETEALAAANSTRYGLAATVWTRDLSRAHRFSAALHSGIVWVNCWMLRDLRTPFGGVKDSGVGREGGQEALRFFTEPKNVCIQT